MNKLGEREYIKLICEALVETYGRDLVEGATDMIMARNILEEMRPFLFFHEQDMNKEEYRAWRESFVRDCLHADETYEIERDHLGDEFF